MEQAVLRYPAGVSGLWLADIDRLRDSGRGSHRSLFTLELRVLSQSDLAADLPGRTVFPGILFFQGGAVASFLDPGYPDQAEAICGPALWSRIDSYGCSLPVSCSPGNPVLCMAVWMDELWENDFARAIDIAASRHFLFGYGFGIVPASSCVDLSLYGFDISAILIASALDCQLLTKQLFPAISLDVEHIGPGFSDSAALNPATVCIFDPRHFGDHICKLVQQKDMVIASFGQAVLWRFSQK